MPTNNWGGVTTGRSTEESVYNLVPPPQEVPTKPPMYRSAHPGKINAKVFEFGARKVQPGATFGRPDGTYAETPDVFLKSHAKEPVLPEPTVPTLTKLRTKALVPRRDEAPVHGLTSNKNFITVNAVNAILLEAKRPAEAPAPYTAKADFGKVPVYLKRNKARLAAEKAAIEEYLRMRDAAAHAGVQPMNESERAQLLRHLKRKWATVNEIYQKLPLSVDSEVKRRTKEGMEKELAGIEKDIKTLERGETVMIMTEQ